MPNRIIREGILTSERIASLSWDAEVFYRRLMSVVDDYGRFDGRPEILRSRLYPLQLEKVGTPDLVKWMRCGAEAGLVRLYAVEGKPYIEILRFGQPIRSASKYPDDGNCAQVRADAPVSVSESGCESVLVSVPPSGGKKGNVSPAKKTAAAAARIARAGAK